MRATCARTSSTVMSSESSTRAALPAQQSQQDVLGADVVVLERARLVLRQDDDLSGTLGEALEHALFSHRGYGESMCAASVWPPAVPRMRACPYGVASDQCMTRCS